MSKGRERRKEGETGKGKRDKEKRQVKEDRERKTGKERQEKRRFYRQVMLQEEVDGEAACRLSRGKGSTCSKFSMCDTRNN